MQLFDFYSSSIQMVRGNYILKIQMYVQWGKNEYSSLIQTIWCVDINPLGQMVGIYYNIMCVLRKMKNNFWLKPFRYFVIFKKKSEC
jgi:hypothetical protein